jgi:hypothetical protein
MLINSTFPCKVRKYLTFVLKIILCKINHIFYFLKHLTGVKLNEKFGDDEQKLKINKTKVYKNMKF